MPVIIALNRMAVVLRCSDSVISSKPFLGDSIADALYYACRVKLNPATVKV